MGFESHGQGMGFEANAKPLKPPSNISDIVSKFAKGCKFRSIGVFSSSECKSPLLAEESSVDATKEAALDAKNIPPLAAEMKKELNECGYLDISKLFDKLSALKLAYVKLQQAHIPYDPDKIRVADEGVVSQLESLCKMKRAYKEKLVKEMNSLSAYSALLLAEIKVQENVLEKLKYQTKDKDNEVLDLRRKALELETRNKELCREISKREKERIEALNLSSFEDVVRSVGKAIHDFAKPLIALMKVSGWDLDEAANSVESSVVYAKRSHKKYAFEAYIARRMFHGVPPEPQNMESIMKLDDPIDALIEDPQSSFATFCKTKYLLLVHPKMETSFFGNLDHRTFVSNGIHPSTPFYRAFVKMARSVWFLMGFTAFTDPEVKMFAVKRGSLFLNVSMEMVDELKDYKVLSDQGQDKYQVEFMIMPGFRKGDTLIRSQVYVSRMESSASFFVESSSG